MTASGESSRGSAGYSTFGLFATCVGTTSNMDIEIVESPIGKVKIFDAGFLDRRTGLKIQDI